MASTPAKKHTISTVAAIFFVGIAVIFDGIKIVLFFIDSIPVVGAPIGFLGSWVVSAFEFICITVGLYIAGAYRGKNATTNALWTMVVGVIDMIPILDDFPSTTIAVVMIIARSRFNDKIEAEENARKRAATEKHKKEQEVKRHAASSAQQRANQVRPQALAISIAAANDNAPQATNNNYDSPLSKAA
jgi:hypothetical protein